MIDALGRAVGSQTAALNRQMDNNIENITALQKKLDRFGDLLEKSVKVEIE